MCIALLGKFFFRPDIIEQIWLDISDDGHLHVTEVYDVFLRAPDSWEGSDPQKSRLLLFSPHWLRQGADGALAVRCEKFPGGTMGRSGYDAVYPSESCHYNGTNKTFQVELVGTPIWRFETSFHKLEGTVITPMIRIPDELQASFHATELMRRIGSICELNLGELVRGRKYAFRLVVEPQELNCRSPINLRDGDGKPTSIWEHELEVISPNLLMENYRNFLVAGAGEYYDAVPAIRSLLEIDNDENSRWFMPAIHRHRLILVCSSTQSVLQLSDDGSVFYHEPRLILKDGPNGDQYRGREWIAGIDANRDDDPYELSLAVLRYMKLYGSKDAKTKEDMTIALNSRHQNVSCVVDALASEKLLLEEDGGRFRARVQVDILELADHVAPVLEKVVTSSAVRSGFRQRGFRVTYLFRYRYDDETVRFHRRRRSMLKYVVSFCAIASALLWLVASICWCLGLIRLVSVLK
jgi:hypothetical protein